MPFFMVHAGKNLFALKSSEKRNRRAERIPLYETSYGLLPFDTRGKIKAQADPQNKGKPLSSLIHASKIYVSSYHTRQNTSLNCTLPPSKTQKYIPPSEPHALCLTVFLSPYNFLPIEHNGEVTVSGVSIHVFFNGQLCDSAYVPKKYASVKHAMAEQIVRFCGQRISRVLEKPWIIVPPGQNPDGSRRNSYGVGRQMSASAEQRWGAVSNAILAEADKAGVNSQGRQISPWAVFGERV